MNNKKQELMNRIKALPPEKRAALLAKLDAEEQQDDVIVAAEQRVSVPISFAQRNLWLVNRLDGASSKYNMASAYKFTGKLNVEAMTKSFKEIVNRHESLRTTFEERNEEVFQVINSADEFSVMVTDFIGQGFDEHSECVVEIMVGNAQYVFELSEGPLIKVDLILLDENTSILIMNVHHIIYDGWSKSLLLRDLYVFYEYFCNFKDQSEETSLDNLLPHLDIQYRDYTAWQLETQNLNEQLDYWKAHLDGAPELLELSTDRPRQAVQSQVGAIERVKIPAELADPFHALARHASVTPFMAMLGAFSLLLSKYSGQDDILVGTPCDNRNRKEIQKVIGYFLNTIVFRTRIDQSKSFMDLLEVVKKTCVGGYSNQGAPWDEIVSQVNPIRSASHTPIFQSMLVFQNAKSHEFRLPGLEIEKIGSGTNTTKYDIYLTFVEKDGLEGWLTYNSDLFDQSTILRMIESLKALIKNIVADPELPVSKLSCVSEGQISEITKQQNGIKKFVLANSIHQQFAQQLKETPNTIVLRDGGRELSMMELDRKSNQFAQRLRESGIGKGDLVGLCFTRSIELVAAILATFKVGGAYVPLDPTQPQQRLEFLVKDASPKQVLTESRFESLVSGVTANVICIDIDTKLAESNVDSFECTPTDGDDLAYVLYTSGSTGNPKGVMGTHKGLLNRLNWMWERYPYAEDEVLIHKTTSNFVDSVAEVWGPVLKGKPLEILNQDSPFDLYDFIELLEEKSITRLVAVPSLVRHILEFYPDLAEKLPSLKQVIVSGEELQIDICKLFYQAAPDCLLINLYGSTEVSADVTYYEVPNKPAASRRVPIGKVLNNNSVYILDKHMQVCPVGVKGELYVSGVGVAKGYYNNQEMTDKAFLENTISNDGSRMYRTGDYARLLPDGNIEPLGRVDTQVKVRGFRIELSEVEAALLNFDVVNEAVCVVSDNGEQRALVAYVVLEENLMTPSQIRESLRDVLPDYMIPTAIVQMNEMPLSVNGKIQRSELPEVDLFAQSSVKFIAPRNETERGLAQIWEEALKVEKVGALDSFFDLGGHSLLASKIISQVRKSFQVNINARDVFDLGSMEKLAARIDELQQQNENSSNESEEVDWVAMSI